MKKEFILIFVIGLFILAYVLDAVVNPLTITLTSPYHYLTPEIYTQYAFTTTSIVIKALGIFLSTLLLLSAIEVSRLIKGGILLGIAGLMQLYALQEVATGAQVLPLEWTISLTLAGMTLLLPTAFYLIRGALDGANKRFSKSLYGEDYESANGSENSKDRSG